MLTVDKCRMEVSKKQDWEAWEECKENGRLSSDRKDM